MNQTVALRGKEITEIHAGSIFQEPNTKDHQYEIEFVLKDDQRFYLTPYGISHEGSLKEYSETLRADIVSGQEDLVGAVIQEVYLRPMTQVANPREGETQVALLLADGRAVLNALKCGGGSSLHVEAFEDVKRYMGDGWSKVG